jgi:hypothetical protein
MTELPSLLPKQELQTPNSHAPSVQKPGHLAFVLIGALLLLIVGTIIWVLNILGIIPGPWSSVFGATFTGTGIIIAVLDSLLTVLHAERRHG